MEGERHAAPWRRSVVPVALMAVMVTATLAAVGWSLSREGDRVQASHEATALATGAALAERIEGTIGGLRGLRGLYNAVPVDAPRFQVVSEAVLTQHGLAGTQWVAYVRRAERAEFEAELGGPISVVDDRGERIAVPPAPAAHAVIEEVAPSRLHRRAIGTDHFANPARRPALMRSRDREIAAVSAPNRLGLAGRPWGIHVFLPVYHEDELNSLLRAGMRPDQARRRALRGWVAGVSILSVLDRAIHAQLAAGSRIAVYDGNRRIMGTALPLSDAGGAEIDVGGRQWTIRANSGERTSAVLPIWSGAGGLIATLLVGLLLIASRRGEASALATLSERREREAAESALAASEARHRTIVDEAADGILVLDAAGAICSANAAARRMFDRTETELIGSGLADIAAPAPDSDRFRSTRRAGALFGSTPPPLGEFSLTGRRRNGPGFPLEITISSIRVAEQTKYTVIARDVGDQRRLEAEAIALRRVATEVALVTEPEPLFDMVAEQVGELHRAGSGSVIRFQGARGVVAGSWGSLHDEVSTVDLAGNGVVAQVARDAVPAIAFDYAAEPNGGVEIARRLRRRSAVAAPVHVGGRLWGALTVDAIRPYAFAPGTEEQLERFAELVGMAIANADARSQLTALASTDELTNLPNQRSFHDRLAVEVERAHREDRDLSLVIFDVDHFKQINDTFGHQAGDTVLVEIAGRLTDLMRSGDMIARVGGEEFAWIVTDTHGAGAWQAAERMREAIGADAFSEVGRVSISGGVCELSRAGSAGELYRLADIALYLAKAHGRDVCFRYTPEVVEVLSAEDRAAQMERVRRFGSIRVLARAVDAKDSSTQRHSERVAEIASELARRLGWNELNVALIYEAALVHDVGKIGVPDHILVKPATLTLAEYEAVKAHAVLGARIVDGSLSVEQVSWVRSHHERIDGRGYPDGLSGDEIPEGARIIAVADAWDAMIGGRFYRREKAPAQALGECEREAGRQFWPPAVVALAEMWRDGAFPPADQARRPRRISASPDGDWLRRERASAHRVAARLPVPVTAPIAGAGPVPTRDG